MLLSPSLSGLSKTIFLISTNILTTFDLTLFQGEANYSFKKKGKTFVANYRPVSVLPTRSKIFERIMQKQITDYIGKFLFPFLCGYRK